MDRCEVSCTYTNGSLCVNCGNDIALDSGYWKRANQSLAIKHDTSKIRLELLPFESLIEVGKVLTFGAVKYADHNWAKGMAWSRLGGGALRHIFAWLGGEDNDSETKLSHLAHAVCCLLFLISYELNGAGNDNRRNPNAPSS